MPYESHPDNRPTRAEAEQWEEEDRLDRILHPDQFGTAKAPGSGTKFEPLYKPGEEPF